MEPVADITLLLWDVGGVLLTNGWDRHARRRAVEKFRLDADDFADRHEQVVADFETGRISIDRYLERAVFYRPQPFSSEEFKAFMFAQSQPCPEAIAIVERLAGGGRYQLATVNNESRELALYRLDRFHLRAHFLLHFTSAFVGLRKPDEAIYRLVVDVTQCPPDRCVFIDDRPLNVEGARRVGMHAVHYRGADELKQELRALGVDV